MTSLFEGRPLARPDQEIVDQGLRFDLTTLLNRRRVLQAFGLGLAGVGLAACSPTGTTTASGTTGTTSTGTTTSADEIPEETAGPYPGDGSNGPDALDTSGIVRSDIRSSFGGATGVAEGVPMTITLTVTDLANGGQPFAGVAVYVWHCDRGGNYSMYSTGVTGENYLRGVQVTDANGQVQFTSIFPACYSGRWPHVHFEVYPDVSSIDASTNAIATSQLALPQDICNTVYARAGYEASVQNLSQMSLATDNVFGDDSAAHQLATVTGDVTNGYAVSLPVGVDTRTAAGGGGSAPGGAMGGPGGTPPSR